MTLTTICFPNTKRNHRETLVPIVVVLVSTINDVKLPRSLLYVFDSGSTGCLYNRNAILCGAKTITIKHPTVLSTTQGTYKSNKVVMLEDFQMMEFTNLRYIWGICASFFDSLNCPYSYQQRRTKETRRDPIKVWDHVPWKAWTVSTWKVSSEFNRGCQTSFQKRISYYIHTELYSRKN